MAIPMDQITSMPAFSPYYPPPPVRYRNARFQFVFFRADPAAVDRVLPACLEPAADGYCVAIGITVPWASSYGAFDESVLSVKCTFKGETGFFAPVAFLNSRSSIPAGREIYGTPKVFAEFECGMDERVAFTNTRLAGRRYWPSVPPSTGRPKRKNCPTSLPPGASRRFPGWTDAAPTCFN